MKQEYPATPEEAFTKLMEGVILGEQIKRMRKEGRVLDLPIDTSRPQLTRFGIWGVMTKPLFGSIRKNGPWHDFILYYEYRLQDLHFIESYKHLRENMASITVSITCRMTFRTRTFQCHSREGKFLKG